MERLGINPWILLAQIANFVLLVVILRLVAYNPIAKILRERQERIQKGLQDAEVAAQARADAEKEREQILAQARADAGRITAELTAQGRTEAEKILAQAREEAERIRSTARQEAEADRAQILGQMREQIATLVVAAARRLIGETLDEQRQRALVESFFSGIREGRVTVLPEETTRLEGPVVVTSALPLSEAEQAALRAYLGDVQDLSFRVDPEILGGLVVRAGDRVVDGSIAGQIEQLRRSLT